jgi:DNA polymerase
MFIGEAPGKFEDLSGKPFVGDAGKLLSKIILAMKLDRAEVYISNILKCRPPNNRDPEKDEIEKCLPFLLKQIEIIKPEIIVTLGRISTSVLLNSNERINNLRGKFYNLNGIKLMPTFHPAHLLHHPENKKLVWQDIQLVMKELGVI